MPVLKIPASTLEFVQALKPLASLSPPLMGNWCSQEPDDQTAIQRPCRASFGLTYQPPEWRCHCRGAPGSVLMRLCHRVAVTLPAPWERCPWLPPRPPLTPVLPAACEHLALGTFIPTRALTPDLVDEPGEGTECSQHAIIPPRSSPARGVASKLPDHLQRLVLTGMRPDLAVCVRSTHPTEKTKLRLLPPPTTPSPGYLLLLRAEHSGEQPC